MKNVLKSHRGIVCVPHNSSKYHAGVIPPYLNYHRNGKYVVLIAYYYVYIVTVSGYKSPPIVIFFLYCKYTYVDNIPLLYTYHNGSICSVCTVSTIEGVRRG